MSTAPYPERSVWLSDARPPTGNGYVLCWLHHAYRADNNAVLETANAYAHDLGCPLLIYAGLGGAHDYNSARSHRFILESARDLHQQLQQSGQRLYFNLPSDPHTPGPLPVLAGHAALIVSELFPAPPFPSWYRALHQKTPDTPFTLVDDRCLVPMTYLEAAPGRAFRFRKAIQGPLSEALDAEPGPENRPSLAQPPDADNLPVMDWEPLDWQTFSLDDAIQSCRIDHGIAPVAHTPGGTQAAQQRWQQFRDEGGLKNYARRRNDAAIDGVSRLSPYLHFGCLSARQIAREAHQLRGQKGMSGGVDKFLDELIIWRELAHHFCYHRQDDLDSLQALPEWARETLAEHQSGPDEVTTVSHLDLEQANTPHPLWNAAQQSLLGQGELHNNVRMSWGKGIAQWSPAPESALQRLLDLNHRYALDGCDPNSYGGLLWCLGQFDRPFPPPRPRLGMVRPRSLDRHAERLDMDAYATHVRRAPDGQPKHVVVIGAGLSGLAAAWHLQQQGHQVTVLEKARGAGGRMSTRRTDNGHFDHGAQYFTARDPRFVRWVERFIDHGLVEQWDVPVGAFDGQWRTAKPGTTRYVAQPGMNAICKHYADLLDVHYRQRVTRISRPDSRWQIEMDDERQLEADQLIFSVPPEQALALLPESLTDMRQVISNVQMLPCWAVMLTGKLTLPNDFEAAFVNKGPLSWIANNSHKPGRGKQSTAILHASPVWSQQHLEKDPETISDALIQTFRNLPQCALSESISANAHRWRYALAQQPLDVQALWSQPNQIGVCGDWCHGSRVEGAFLSGQAVSVMACGLDG